MKKYFLLSILFLILFFSNLKAQNVISEETVKIVAKNFYAERLSAYKSILPKHVVIENIFVHTKNNKNIFHIVSIKNGGYVIIAPNKFTTPVLAYSFEGNLDMNNQPANFKAWMTHYEEQILYILENNVIQNKYEHEWDRLLNLSDDSRIDFTKQKSVLPLISSRWNQGKYYNGLCPKDPDGPDGRAYAGCVATAMGQLLYYHRWPINGTGSYSYSHPKYGTIASDFENTYFDWEGMANSINKPNKAIAELLFNMGVAVDMNYGPNGSGMWNHSAARSMRNYFKYGTETEYVFRDSTNIAWDSLLIANLDAQKPLYYAGWTQNPTDSSGHAFVCDGYQGFDYFHFDWGWGGSFNGYFYLNQLTPGGAVFNFRQEVIKDIYPDTINYTYPVYCSNNKILTDIVGSISDNSGIKNYQSNANCSWLIAPALFVQNIKLDFDLFDTEAHEDIVRVYDGADETAPLLGEFSGSTLPNQLVSTGNKMYITFTSNDTIEKQGFTATYNATIPSYCSPIVILSNASDTISDGSGNNTYNYLTNCRWRIQPPNTQTITLNFLSFDIDDNVDFLEIYDLSSNPAVLLDSYTGNTIPATKSYNTSIIMVWFKSNTYEPKAGWELIYSASATSVEESTKRVNINLYPNPANNTFNINIENDIIKYLEIFTANGQSYYENKQINNQTYSIDVNSWSKGYYLCKVHTSNSILYKKLIIY